MPNRDGIDTGHDPRRRPGADQGVSWNMSGDPTRVTGQASGYETGQQHQYTVKPGRSPDSFWAGYQFVDSRLGPDLEMGPQYTAGPFTGQSRAQAASVALGNRVEAGKGEFYRGG